ncbi:hypothetical protein PMIN03_012839 [Paraphaeosphaeria minitans]
MCSYQKTNHSYRCQKSKLLNGPLKTEFGFEGFVVSDWGANHSGVASASAGLDIIMPNGGYWGKNLTEAVNNGSVSTERVDGMATRILAIGIVLIKNVDNTLPLNNPRFLSIYGYGATVKSTPWQNSSRFCGGFEVNYGWNTLNGTMITGGGSGSSTPSYVISPFHALSDRIAKNRGNLRWDFESETSYPPYVNSETCLVVFSDNLIKNVAANCTNTIVIIHPAGIGTVDTWISHDNITAVFFAGLPGQESSNSLVDILYGDVAPSGALLNSSVFFDYFPQDDFQEGLDLDYRAFDKNGIEPQFEFGYGLTYTTFDYADLSVSQIINGTAEYPNPDVAIAQSGNLQLGGTSYCHREHHKYGKRNSGRGRAVVCRGSGCAGATAAGVREGVHRPGEERYSEFYAGKEGFECVGCGESAVEVIEGRIWGLGGE